MAIKRSFDPVVDASTRLLVLGSLPGERSLAHAQYYAHPQNQFWRLMGHVIGIELAELDYEERLQTLLRHHVGLWDVVASAHRRGSLDADIREHETNDLTALVARLPQLRAIAFNGGKSARMGRKVLGQARVELVDLPSSSPAYTLAFVAKSASWDRLKAYLA